MFSVFGVLMTRGGDHRPFEITILMPKKTMLSKGVG